MAKVQKTRTTYILNMPILIIILLHTESACGQFGNYSYPSDSCKAATIPPYHDAIQLYCTVTYLPPDANYASIQTRYTRELTFHCTSRFRISNIDSAFSHLTELQTLQLISCSFYELSSSFFTGLSSLKTLNIIGSFRTQLGVIEPGALSRLKSLEYVNLGDNALRSLPYQFFCSLQNLRILQLNVNSFSHMNSTGLQCYINANKSPLLNLTTLDVSDNYLRGLGKPLHGYIPNVINLNMSNNGLQGLEPESLHNLTKLKTLDLSHNKLTTATPTLQTLDLSRNKLTINAHSFSQLHLKDLINLENLLLDNNKLSQIDTNIFQANPRLKTLGLSQNGLTDQSVTSSLNGSLNFLEKLDMSRNLITTLIPNIFRNLTSLISVKLNDNQITGIADGTFQSTKRLQNIDISSNLLENITQVQFYNKPTSYDVTSFKLLRFPSRSSKL